MRAYDAAGRGAAGPVLPSGDAVPMVLDAQRELAQRAGAPANVREWAAACLAWSERHRAALERGASAGDAATRRRGDAATNGGD